MSRRIEQADVNASLAARIVACNAIRDRCRADLDAMTDEDGAEWIDAYYAVIEAPCLSAADAIAKCQFLALALDGQDMGWFEEEKVIRQIAALAGPTVHPDAKLLKLGEKYRAVRQAEIALYKEIGDDESPETMARVDKLGWEMGRLSRAILATQPKTVDGLRVIAQVWGTHHINMDGSWPPEPAHTDTQAVHAVMRWLIEGGAA